jgi:hypothetical protein
VAAATIGVGFLAFAEDAGGGAVLAAGGGAATAGADCTTRLSTTVLTPAIWVTSLVAMSRAVSLVTVPFKVTTPAAAEAWMVCPLRFWSAARLLATFAFRVASSGAVVVPLQPASSMANESAKTVVRVV